MKIRKLKESEADRLSELYRCSFGKLYPPFRNPKFFEHVCVGRDGNYVCANDNDEIIGFASVAIKSDNSKEAVLRTLFVSQEYRKQGVGSKLLECVEKFAKERDAKKIILGPLIDDYFTLGVPACSAEYEFFVHRGFSEDIHFGYRPVWMSIDLNNWQPPKQFEAIRERLKSENILLRISTADDQRRLAELTKKHFRGWYEKFFAFGSESTNPAPCSIVIQADTVAGFAGPLWVREKQFGELGAVGVSPDFRRRGIGLAVVTQACKWWQTNGAKQGDLWTGTNNPAVKLYEQVGFYIVETYVVISKSL